MPPDGLGGMREAKAITARTKILGRRVRSRESRILSSFLSSLRSRLVGGRGFRGTPKTSQNLSKTIDFEGTPSKTPAATVHRGTRGSNFGSPTRPWKRTRLRGSSTLRALERTFLSSLLPFRFFSAISHHLDPFGHHLGFFWSPWDVKKLAFSLKGSANSNFSLLPPRMLPGEAKIIPIRVT